MIRHKSLRQGQALSHPRGEASSVPGRLCVPEEHEGTAVGTSSFSLFPLTLASHPLGRSQIPRLQTQLAQPLTSLSE